MRRAIALFNEEEPMPDTIATLDDTYFFADENGIDIEMLTHIIDVFVYARSIISDYAADNAATARAVCAIALRLGCRIATWSNDSFADIANRCFGIGLPDRIAWRFASLIIGRDALRRDESEAKAIPPNNLDVRLWFDLVDAALTDALEQPMSLFSIGKAFGAIAESIDANHRPNPFEIALIEEETGPCSILDSIRKMMTTQQGDCNDEDFGY